MNTARQPNQDFPEICVCICAYRRPDSLRHLLATLADLDTATPPFRVVIVDNDHARSSADVATEWIEKGLPITYTVESDANISKARNRAIRECDTPFIAFIDDDEWADPFWLARLHQEITRHGAHAAFGPVEFHFATKPPQWLVQLGFFAYPDLKTGEKLAWHHARTSNVLLRTSAIAGWSEPFDPEIGNEGGEDTDLFARMLDRGDLLISVNDAVVHETVPAERMSFAWLVRRYFRNGSTAERIIGARLTPAMRWKRCVKMIGESTFRLILGLPLAIFLPGKGIRQLLRGVFCAGCVSRFFGIGYQEYATQPDITARKSTT